MGWGVSPKPCFENCVSRPVFFKTCVPQVIQIRIVMFWGDVVSILFRLMSMDLEDSLAPAKIVVDVVRGFEPGTFEFGKFRCLKI